MKYPVVVASLALILACLAGGQKGFWFGQTELAAQEPAKPLPPLPPLPPPLPVLDRLPQQPVKAATDPLPAIDLAGDAAASQTGDNHPLRLEPAISLEWVGPQSVSINRRVTFHVLVKNGGLTSAEHVVVRNRLPAGVKLVAAEPKPATDGNLLTWELGTIEPRQEKRLELQLLPDGKGDYACQASVTFTAATAARFQVREPKLVVKVAAPDKVLVGDSATLNLTVTNCGDGTASHVKVKTTLPDGLQHVRGKIVEFDLGALAPKETRICKSSARAKRRESLSAKPW